MACSVTHPKQDFSLAHNHLGYNSNHSSVWSFNYVRTPRYPRVHRSSRSCGETHSHHYSRSRCSFDFSVGLHRRVHGLIASWIHRLLSRSIHRIKSPPWRAFSFDRHDVQGLGGNLQLHRGSCSPLTCAHHLAWQLQSDSLTRQSLWLHGAQTGFTQ